MQQYIHKYRNYLTWTAFIFIVTAFIADGTMKSILLITASVLAGAPILMKAVQAVQMKAFSIELLVMMAVIGAFLIGEYTEAAVVTFLFLFGDYLEGKTLEKTRASLRGLMAMAPAEAVVIRGEKQLTIRAEDVQAGDRVIIRSGASIPVDGKVVAGQGAIVEAAVTGESVPVNKTVHDKVYSGTIVDNGYLEIKAEKVGEETTFSKMIELVEDAQESKSKAEKLLDQFSRFYTPAILIVALLVYGITRDFHLAITFLVIACPGALVIGAPVSNVAGIGNGAKNGVLMKGGEVMHMLSKADTVVFDKTGTLTKGRPEVTDIHVFSGNDEEMLLALAAGAESISEHHLGKTIIRAAENRGIRVIPDVADGEIIKGQGIRAHTGNHNLVIGSLRLMEQSNIPVTNEITAYADKRERLGNTAVFMSVDNKLEAIISIADAVRTDAKEAIAGLRKHGVKQVFMLTGDNAHTAELIAKQLELDGYHANLFPEDKVKYVKDLKEQGHVVAMAGDGINDAPAIAAADIGIAMGDGGTDISMETADVVLMADRLMQLTHAYKLAKATIRNMKQNIFLAVATVVILLAGVLNGTVHLASGMFIHEASVLLVIVNGMRLTAFNRKREKQQKQYPALQKAYMPAEGKK